MKLKGMKMDSRMVNRLLLGLILLLLLGSLFGSKSIVGQLKYQTNQLVSLKAKKQALETEQTNLAIAKKEVAKYASLEKIAESIVPQDKDQAQTVREIVDIAAASNIKLTSIDFPTSTLGQTSTTKAAQQRILLSQLTPVKGIARVYVLPISVKDDQQADATTYSNFLNFLTKLEQNRRTSEVTNLSIQPQSDGLITFSLTINEYIRPI